MKNLLKNHRGSALVVGLLMLVMLSFIAIASVTTSVRDMSISHNTSQKTKAFNIAESGIELALATVNDNSAWRAGYANQSLGSGLFSVVVVDSSDDASLLGNLRVNSTGSSGNSESEIEAIFGPPGIHPLFYHAIYAGNSEEYDPDADSQVWTDTMYFSGNGSDRDRINGDVFFNGHVVSDDDAVVNGTIDAGGNISGNSPTDGANSGVDYLEPPDLAAMNYPTLADYVINTSSPWDLSGRINSSDPRHIFVKDFRTDLADDYGFDFDNTNFFLGDPWEGSNIDEISVSSAGNHKVYFVDGNLWIEPQGQTSKIIESPPDGTQITIVARGNIYFSDDFLYDNQELDAVAFIAMTDGESYTDMDGDNQYDAGEPILHDNGNGVYNGPAEGSGNVFFGDPNGGPLGDVHGYIYAENNFEDHVLDPESGEPLDFSITGLMSAGNRMRIERDFAGGHAEMDVTYDSRLQDGSISLPGLPGANGNGGPTVWTILSWREIY
ncbi:MAG: pilus assembly PilX N-terminal domain-containing protein [candidate division Zixibacteria bacterium]|nr:pilus assembly PilX N-terminal domain-containing protein [candidate division Zixibacteria bacterium]